MRNYIKTIFYIVCFFISIPGFAFFRKRNSIIILMYHSFDDKNWKFGVDPNVLKKQIIFLLKNKNIISFSDAVSYLECKKKVSRNSVVITVDDGYEDTYTVLYPLAKKYRFPFTIFLTSDLSPQKKLGNLKRPTWEQIKEMSESGLVSVEVHGHSHINWTEIEKDKNMLKNEILKCRDEIEKKIKHKSLFCAYPAGRGSKKIKDFLCKNKFRAAVSITEGSAKCGDDLFSIKRVQVDRTMNMFLFILRLKPAVLKIVNFFRKFI